jgi:hypothetical protein
MSIKTTGSLSPDDHLGSDPDLIKLFGSGFSLGGPIIVHDTAVDPNRPDTIGHVVEIKAAVATNPPGFSASDYTLKQTLQVELTIKFSNGFQLGPQSGPVGDDGPQIYQNNTGQNLYEIDAPGPGANAIFAYFGPNPPPIDGQPPGTTVTSMTFRMHLVTKTISKSNGSICGTLKWFTQYVITGGDLSHVTSTAGSE